MIFSERGEKLPHTKPQSSGSQTPSLCQNPREGSFQQFAEHQPRVSNSGLEAGLENLHL